MKKLLWITVLIAVVAAAVVLYQHNRTTPKENVTENVRRATIERGELVVTVSATGSIVPRAEANLSFELPGKVKEVWVEVGDTVKVDEKLARLDTTKLEFNIRQAEAALASAKAQLAQIKAGARDEEITVAEANLAAAEATLWNAIEQRDLVTSGATAAEIASAEAQIASALSQEKVARDTHDMTMRCETVQLPTGEEREVCPGLGTPEEQARFNLHAAEKALAAAEAQLDQLMAGASEDQIAAANANVAAATAQRDAAQAQLELAQAEARSFQIDAAQANIDQAQVALDIAHAELLRATLSAPFDGIVTAVNVNEKEIAPATLPAISLVDRSELQILVNVDEMDVARIQEGQPVNISLDALPEESIPGHVERIAPAATQAANVVMYQVTIVLDKMDAPLRIGMSATADIKIEHLEDVLLVPNWAVRIDRTDGSTYVNLLRQDKVTEIEIELGVQSEDMSQVLFGLEPGDVVVAGDVEGLQTLLEQGE